MCAEADSHAIPQTCLHSPHISLTEDLQRTHSSAPQTEKEEERVKAMDTQKETEIHTHRRWEINSKHEDERPWGKKHARKTRMKSSVGEG